MSRQIRTLALDFDGVLHQYAGYQKGLIQGPIPGAKEAAWELVARGHTVVVFTTRPAGLVKAWLAKHEFPPLDVTDRKTPFFIILDDRGMTFRGKWNDELLDSIERFRPHWWTQRPKKAV